MKHQNNNKRKKKLNETIIETDEKHETNLNSKKNIEGKKKKKETKKDKENNWNNINMVNSSPDTSLTESETNIKPWEKILDNTGFFNYFF